MDKIIKVGCVIFVLKDQQLLLGKRKNVYGAGYWGLSGGHLEYGEKLIDAAKRELEEETGIKNAKLSLIGIIDDPRGNQHYVHISFKLLNFDGNVILNEPDKCQEWKFFPLEKLPKNIFVGHRIVIKTFQKEALYLY